jgi:hypothetical protein
MDWMNNGLTDNFDTPSRTHIESALIC